MRCPRATRGSSATRRILLVDRHPLARRGLTALIDDEPDLRVCAAVATQRAGLEAIAAFTPDLVIAELWFADGDDLALLKASRASAAGPPVLVLTMHDAPRHVRRAVRAGARGYVSKQESGETVLAAIRGVLAGQTYVSPRIRAGLEGAPPRRPLRSPSGNPPSPKSGARPDAPSDGAG